LPTIPKRSTARPLDDASPPPTRAGAVVREAVGRPLLLVFWALILWGTIILGALAWKALTEGPRASLRAAQAQVAGPSVWGWVNVSLASLSLLVFLLIAGGVLGRRDRRP
jgi:hypothetical protein